MTEEKLCEFCGKPATLALDQLVFYCDECRHKYWPEIMRLCNERDEQIFTGIKKEL